MPRQSPISFQMGTKNVLIIDGNEAMQKVRARVLRSRGVHVHTAKSVAEAELLWVPEFFDLVLAQLGLERDLRFGWDMWAWARLQAGTGKSPVFYYSFQQQPPFPAGSVYADWGASHFAELWYVFDHLDQSPWNLTVADRKLAEEMSTYWVNFARSGDPNGSSLPRWPTFTNAEGKVQYLDAPITVGGVANIHGLSTFDAVYTTVRGTPFAAQATAG